MTSTNQLKDQIKDLKWQIRFEEEKLVERQVEFAKWRLIDPKSPFYTSSYKALMDTKNRIKWKKDTLQKYNHRLKRRRERHKAVK